MADPEDGWQTVLPTKNSGIERLSRSQLEAYERQILREWESTRGHWSGMGKHTGTSAQDYAEAKKIHARFKSAPDKVLGSGSYGVVEKVNFFHNNKTVCLARKHIQYRRGFSIQLLREEAHVMEKLDHEHIVRLVGTYCVRPHELYLLLWPVAVCNLDSLFNDLDLLKSGGGDRDDIISRLNALDLDNFQAIERGSRPAGQALASQENCPLDFLKQIMGCITRAVAYCHDANIRHLDLKPSNILLNPGRVYLADFGIAKDVNDRDRTMTMGVQGTPKWRAPEIHSSRDEWSMKAADVYSLGLVLLNIATVLYGGNLADFDVVMGDLTARGRAEKLAQYHTQLESLALATQEVEDVNAPSFAPKHVVGLTCRMLAPDPSKRPVVNQVATELVELGGIDQIYHSPCCKKSSRFVTERINTKYKQVVEERNRLRAEREPLARRLEVLERMDETYETRIQNERRAQAEKIAALQEQLQRERGERERAEAALKQWEKRQVRQTIPVPSSSRRISGSGPPAGGLVMQTRRTHPLVSTIPNGPPSLPQPSPRASAPAVTFNTRLSYSQTAAAAITPRVVSPSNIRRPDAAACSQPESPGPSAIPVASPSPDTAGFPLRSRNSGSRLPRAVNPATPIRSNTPALNRDPSSTDSTQLSMSSSVFSRLSSSRYSESAAGTPAIGSPAVNTTNGGEKEASRPSIAAEVAPSGQTDQIDPEIDARHVAQGMGLGIMERRESITNESASFRDTASVISGTVPGTMSPAYSGSALSSPRAVHAVPDMHGGGFKVPSMPTAKSWADVARSRRKPDPVPVPVA
ncbi:kinase-like domain-containing protein [Cercophora newfieldiana]|uniref:Kinase-like domain-containing protein n=1 Tax=Cercophora newfieldiana TaxID=92897 RepID=A0AA39Y0Y2_9PEZI|nr:kinase-like domain-containing protein [Cercophora newfieldiana]